MRTFLRFAAPLACFTLSSLSVFAAPIVFFSTGVDDNGFLLPDFADDPHYTVTVAPPGGSTGAPNASGSIPSPPWIANGPFSRWIVPPGTPVSSDTDPFVFRQTFNISSPLVNESYILMRVSSDNFLRSVRVNNTESGIVYGGDFTVLSAQMAVQNGFVRGQNTIDFPVINAAPNDNPVGLRVDVIDTYQPPANHSPITGLVNTGAASHDGPSLPHGSDVPVWTLTASPPGTPGIKVHTSAGAFPIPPWVSDNNSSAWIGPNDPDINGLPGDYEYSITFDLTGFDLNSVIIRGLWATDNGGIGIFLNGVDTGNLPSASFTDPTFFSLSTAEGEVFNPGLNTLAFRLNNAGDALNPTGFRAEFLTATGIIPEPGTTALLAVAAVACMSRKRLRARAR